MADLTLVVNAATNPGIASFKALGDAILSFSKDAIKAFADQEKADAKLSATLTRLGLDSKTLTTALKAQASAFQETLGVSDDVVQEMQSLLLQFGTAPKDIEKTTQAILDYAAFTGKEAVDATKEFQKFVQTGKGELRQYGVELVRSSDKAKDLNVVVGQVADTFRDSAAKEAATLAGQMRITNARVGELKEGFGEFLIRVESKLGVMKTLNDFFKAANEVMQGSIQATFSLIDRNRELNKLHLEKIEILKRLKDGTSSNVELDNRRLATLRDLIDAHRAQTRELDKEKTAEGEAKAALDATERSRKQQESAIRDQTDALKKLNAEQEKHLNEMEDALREEMAQKEKVRAVEVEEEDKHKEGLKRKAELEQEWIRNSEEGREKYLKKMSEMDDKARQESFQTGAAIANMMLQGLEQEFERASAEGGEVDIGSVVKSILPGIVSLAVVAALGPEAAPFAPAIAGGVSLLLKQFHNGGMVEKYHDGGSVEVPAVLEAGEYVVPRKQVQALGGGAGVRRALGGGGGGVTIISALDARSFQDRAGTDIGSAQARVLRQHRGDLAQLLKRSGVNLYY